MHTSPGVLTAEFVHQLPATQRGQHGLERQRLQAAAGLAATEAPPSTRQPDGTVGGRGRGLPVDGGQQELHQQGGALSGLDGVCGGQTLAELVEERGHQVLQPAGGDDGARLHGVQPAVSDGLDHVVDVDQVDWTETETSGTLGPDDREQPLGSNSRLHRLWTNRSLQAVR